MNLRRIIAVFRLIRLPNLFIIALVLYLQRLCIVVPALQQAGDEPGWVGYGFVVLGTVLIAAGGYLINDFFDAKIDAVNRPGKSVFLQLLLPVKIKTVYIAITLAGLFSVAYACYLSGIYVLWLVFFLVAAVLLWYSYQLKRVPLAGNFVVAVASAMVMPVAWLYDMTSLPGLDSVVEKATVIYSGISARIVIYSIFAFLVSFAREIIKDIEDREGDSFYGCRSLPLVYGARVAKNVIISTLGLTLILLCWWQSELFSSGLNHFAIYLAIAVDLPLIWLSVYVIRMRTKAQNHIAGMIAKMIMVTGILSMLWFLV